MGSQPGCRTCQLRVSTKVSPGVLPLSDRLIPVIAVVSLTSSVCAPGTPITGTVPVTVMLAVTGVASLLALPPTEASSVNSAVNVRRQCRKIAGRRVLHMIERGLHIAERAGDSPAPGPNHHHRRHPP